MKKILKAIGKTLIIITLLLIVILLIYKTMIYPRKYKDIVEQAASMYNVDPNLIYAIIKQESGFKSNAISPSGAKGLMQLMDPTAKEVARKINTINAEDYNIFDPYTNIQIGTKYLAYLINYFDGNYYIAIIAYNARYG